MDLIYDVEKQKNRIERSIKKYGFFAEHNYMHYLNQRDEYSEDVFVSFEDDKGILCLKYDDNSWDIFSECLSPEEERVQLIDEFLSHIFTKEKARKCSLEVLTSTRKTILKKLKDKYHICRLNYSLRWPVYNLKKWNQNVPGRRFKKLRNILNRFIKYHKIKVVDSKTLAKEDLKAIVEDWIKVRLAKDRVNKQPFMNLIDNNFKGCDFARSVIVNGEPCTITAGWKIPNSNDYYSGIGILNYKHKGLGEFSNYDDLNFLKKQGFDHADFGGSDDYLLDFKKKFRPEHIYDTHIFSIMPKRQANIEVVTDERRCKALWEKYSPKERLFDLWDIRKIFHNGEKLKFYHLKDEGILPLWYDKNSGYEFFGGNFPEENTFFIRDKKRIKELLNACSDDTSLYYISESEKQFYRFRKSDIRYYMDVEKLGYDMEKFFLNFSKKHRKNLKYDLKHFEQNYKPEIMMNNIDDVKKLREFNIKNFGKESDYNDEAFYRQIKKMVAFAQKREMLRMVSIKVDGKVQAVDVGIVYNGVLNVLCAGRNRELKNIGKFMNLQHVKLAIKEKIPQINFCTTEAGWKELWNLEKEQLYEWDG